MKFRRKNKNTIDSLDTEINKYKAARREKWGERQRNLVENDGKDVVEKRREKKQQSPRITR